MLEDIKDQKYNVNILDIINTSLTDKGVIAVRHELADYMSSKFIEVSEELRKYEEGEGEPQKTINTAFALILEIASSLMSGANALFLSGNTYAGAALVRQLVEIEYLAWAFEENQIEAKKWIHSNKKERLGFFTPQKLRKAAKGRFRGEDYSYHCELGGHPVPGASILFENAERHGQLLLSDMLSHSKNIWRHIFRWAEDDAKEQQAVLLHQRDVLAYYIAWETVDITTKLPPPP
jgi:hypothetical protein